MIKMNGNQKFVLNNEELEFGILDLWRSKYANIYNMQDVIAEFLVEKALGIDKAQNTDYWTLWDISYKGVKIEIKSMIVPIPHIPYVKKCKTPLPTFPTYIL